MLNALTDALALTHRRHAEVGDKRGSAEVSSSDHDPEKTYVSTGSALPKEPLSLKNIFARSAQG